MKRFLLCSVLGLFGVATVVVHAVGCPVVSCPAPAAVTSIVEEEEPEEVLQTRRMLSVKNDTKERLTVFVRYRTLTSKLQWRWFPAAAATSEDALSYDLEPGEEVSLEHDGWAINANRVRIWAVSQGESGNEWIDNKDTDLWLVSEFIDGYRSYKAAEMETYTFTISP